MSNTNDTSKPAKLEDNRPLVDSELDAVSGGGLALSHEATHSSSSGSGGGGHPDIQPISIVKLFDRATP